MLKEPRTYGYAIPIRQEYSDPAGRAQADYDAGRRWLGPRLDPHPAGASRGYLEAFVTLYDEIADVIAGSERPLLPGIEAGLEGMWFIEAAIASSKARGAWIARK